MLEPRMLFEIQTRNPDNGYWQDEMTFYPAYEYDETVTQKSFLVWTWEKKVRKQTNYFKANENARMRAIHHAKTFRKRRLEPGTRIVVVHANVDVRDATQYNRTESVIWEDGKFLDC